MDASSGVYRLCIYCLWLGSGLMSFALFLHPMSPEDFLALAFWTPAETIQTAYGIQAAILFWISLSLIAAGSLALIFFLKKPHRNTKNTSTYHMDENWYFL